MPNLEHFKVGREVFNRQDRAPWYRVVKNSAGPSQVTIFDEIGWLGTTAQDFCNELATITGDLDLHLASNGGEVFDGIAIFNALKNRRGVVTVYVDSIAASIASVIAQAASPGRLLIAPTASMMIHEAQGMAGGPSSEMAKMAALLDQQSDNIASIYAERTGKPAAYWRSLMKDETWFVGQQAVDAGLADRLATDAPTAVLAGAGIRNAAEPHSPSGWIYRDERWQYDPDGDGDDDSMAETDEDGDFWGPDGKQLKPIPPKPGRDEDRGWIQRAGQWVYDPADDGDDDSTPEGDTDHDYWSHDGEQLQPIPERPEMGNRGTRVLNAGDVDTSAWDAARAWHNGATAADPAKFYAGICAGKKEGDPSKQSSWALPYKYSPASKPNAAGVRNALSRLPQTEGLTNEQEARTLLEGLMKKVNPDYEPSASNTTTIGDWNPSIIQAAW